MDRPPLHDVILWGPIFSLEHGTTINAASSPPTATPDRGFKPSAFFPRNRQIGNLVKAMSLSF